MRILIAFPSHSWSTADVANGYHRALQRVPGVAVKDWRLWPRLEFWHEATRAWSAVQRKRLRDQGIPTKRNDGRLQTWGIALKASEDLVIEALEHRADWVIIVAGIGFHPNVIVHLRRAGINVAAVFTECPYADKLAQDFARVCNVVGVNDRASVARVPNSFYLPTAYDREIHHPYVMPESDKAADVLFIGTGFIERQRLLERVNWDGMSLRLAGLWKYGQRSPLWDTHLEQRAHHLVDNDNSAMWYRAARVNLNLYRTDKAAESMNPRAYELAALGVFSLHEDARPETREVFGDSVGYFRPGDPASLEEAVHHYLASPAERDRMARESMERVAGHSYDDRLAALLRQMESATVAGARHNVVA